MLRAAANDLQLREVMGIMLFQSARGFWLLAGVAGLGLIVFGSVWMTAVFARFEKVPADWEQSDKLEGTFTFVDEAFLSELQGNDTIAGLMSSPDALSLLAQPQVSSLLGSPALGPPDHSDVRRPVEFDQVVVQAVSDPPQ